MSKNIFEGEFNLPSRSEWEAKILSDLNIDSLEKLQSKSYEDIIIDPIYTNENRSSRSSDIHEIIKVAKEGGNQWISGQVLFNKSLHELEEVLNTQKDFDVKATLFSNGASFNYYHLPFLSKDDLKQTIKDYSDPIVFDFQELNVLYMDWINPDHPSEFTFVFDAFSLYEQSKDKELFNFQLKALSTCLEKKNYRIAITTQSFSKYGITSIQELAYTISQLVEVVEALKDKFNVSDIFNKIDILMPIDSNYFFQIAKFRALRYLWQSILESYDLKNIKCRLFGISSSWNKSLYDSETNLLRLSTEAMAASIASADMVFLAAYDFHNQNSKAALRYSAHINNLLKHESYLKDVVDASYGSYYIEAITEEMIEKSYQKFLRIEEDKGFIAYIESNKLSDEIRSINTIKKHDINSTKLKILGTNLHPSSNESKEIRYHSELHYFNVEEIEAAIKKLNIDLSKAQKTKSETLLSPSTKDFDLLRKNRQTLKIAIIAFGDKTFNKARSSFVNSLLLMINAKAEIIEINKIDDFDIVFFCSSDDDYTQLLSEEKLKTETKQKRYIAGNLTNKEDFEVIHISDFVHAKMDHVAFLTQLSGGNK